MAACCADIVDAHKIARFFIVGDAGDSSGKLKF